MGATLKLVACALITLSAASAAAEAPSTSGPDVPYENVGACPFECCTYRMWTVAADTDILADRKDAALVAFRVRRGTRVRGVTGVVVTTKPGRARVQLSTTLGTDARRVRVKPGDPVFVLHYLGEGYWKLWVQGRVVEDGLQDEMSGCVNDAQEPVTCAVRLIEKPQTVWWVKVRSRGREGWTRQVDHFSDIDACG
jgi:hypothetical protein